MNDPAAQALEVTAVQMRLDALALSACKSLGAAGIPHALLKGPTTAAWLYDPPRVYRDVDLLVPASQARTAVQRLAADGVAAPSAGQIGEDAHHSVLLAAPNGHEIDLHVTLPSTELPSEATEPLVWAVLEKHRQAFSLDGDNVPGLDEAGRCLVIALHALSATSSPQALEDLERARKVASAHSWTACFEMAAELGVLDRVEAAVAFIDGDRSVDALPLEFRLLDQGAAGAYQLQRLARLPLHRLPWQLLRELFPTKGFMRHAYPDAVGLGLALAYVHRLRLILRRLPQQVAILLREQRSRPR